LDNFEKLYQLAPAAKGVDPTRLLIGPTRRGKESGKPELHMG